MNTASPNAALSAASPDTATSPKNIPINYRDYYDNFDMSTLLTEIFAEHLDDRLNAYMACCGRHVRDGRGDTLALVHEDTAGNVTRMSFAELDKASAQVANLLQSYGVQVGDQVATMLPRTPELLTIVLATWRIGAVYQRYLPLLVMIPSSTEWTKQAPKWFLPMSITAANLKIWPSKPRWCWLVV